MDEEFFKNYKKSKVEEGIPGLEMNAPLNTNKLKGQLGIELEMEARTRLPRDGGLEGVQSSKTKAQWLGHQDGSLRGEAIEYVLSTPVLPEEVGGMIDGLYDALEKNKTVLECSNRCSTHVHRNMSGQTINVITSTIALWATFEDQFVEWCGEERQTNHFCLGMKDSLSTVQAWEGYLKSGVLPRGRELKYAAMNVMPLFERGSLEFRCGPAPQDKEKVKQYVAFVYALTEYARQRYQNPQQLAYDLSEQGGPRILREICSGEDTRPVFEEMNKIVTDKTALEGFRRIQPLLMAHPWPRWLELINREYVPNPFGKKKPAENDFIEVEEAPVPVPAPFDPPRRARAQPAQPQPIDGIHWRWSAIRQHWVAQSLREDMNDLAHLLTRDQERLVGRVREGIRPARFN